MENNINIWKQNYYECKMIKTKAKRRKKYWALVQQLYSKKAFLHGVADKCGQPLPLVRLIYEAILIQIMEDLSKGIPVCLNKIGYFYFDYIENTRIKLWGKHQIIPAHLVVRFFEAQKLRSVVAKNTIDEECDTIWNLNNELKQQKIKEQWDTMLLNQQDED